MTEPVTIVLVEDDPGHARLIQKNLQRAGITNPIVTLEDGEKALAYLFDGATREGPRGRPALLLLLDINLPVVDGYEVLRRVKEHPRTRRIPVIMLTTTDSPREIARCYELGCNVYITKPVDYDTFSAAIRNLGLFLSVVKLPGD